MQFGILDLSTAQADAENAKRRLKSLHQLMERLTSDTVTSIVSKASSISTTGDTFSPAELEASLAAMKPAEDRLAKAKRDERLCGEIRAQAQRLHLNFDQMPKPNDQTLDVTDLLSSWQQFIDNIDNFNIDLALYNDLIDSIRALRAKLPRDRSTMFSNPAHVRTMTHIVGIKHDLEAHFGSDDPAKVAQMLEQRRHQILELKAKKYGKQLKQAMANVPNALIAARADFTRQKDTFVSHFAKAYKVAKQHVTDTTESLALAKSTTPPSVSGSIQLSDSTTEALPGEMLKKSSDPTGIAAVWAMMLGGSSTKENTAKQASAGPAGGGGAGPATGGGGGAASDHDDLDCSALGF